MDALNENIRQHREAGHLADASSTAPGVDMILSGIESAFGDKRLREFMHQLIRTQRDAVDMRSRRVSLWYTVNNATEEKEVIEHEFGDDLSSRRASGLRDSEGLEAYRDGWARRVSQSRERHSAT
jgi:hypothetical protein